MSSVRRQSVRTRCSSDRCSRRRRTAAPRRQRWSVSRGGRVASVKFCGLTRSEDAREALRLGAAYVGAIFAGGPRNVTPERARELYDAAAGGPAAVGVFGADEVNLIAADALTAGVEVIQLHGDPRAADVRAIR